MNRYLYQGKEIQNDHDLGLYDHGAKFYDPVIGRWSVVDPKADHPQQIGISPYAGMNNNPILYVDPDGQLPIIPIIWAAYEIGSAIYDGYQAYKTISDKNATTGEKWAAVGGVAASAILPGGGYGTAAKTTVKAVDKAMDANKVVSKADDVAGNIKTFGGKQSTESVTSKEAFGKAKEANSIPRSQQPDNTIKANTPEGKKAGLDDRNVKQYEYTNSKGEKVIIRQDKPAAYRDGGQQGRHYNAGNANDNKLKQHHYYDK